MDTGRTARAYRLRADAREAERVERYRALRRDAALLAAALREAFGPRVQVYLFGSLLDLDRFRGGSDLDVAVEGLEPAEYWEAWELAESTVRKASLDLVRLETAPAPLREHIRTHGELLT